MLVRFQIFILFIPLTAGWALSEFKNIRPVISLLLTTILCSVLILAVGSTVFQTDLPELLSQKQQSFLKLADESDAGSIIHIPALKPTVESLIQCLPSGLSTALLRPFITDGKNALSWISSIENTIILLFIFWCVAGRLKMKSNETSVFFWFALFYSM